MPMARNADVLIFAVGHSDGSFSLWQRGSGGQFKEDKRVSGQQTHRGGITCIRWSVDATTLATAGEDGVVKTWSRNGMLRNTIDRLGAPVYALAWASDSEGLVYASAKHLFLKAPGATRNWKAHEGIVLSVSWST